MFEHEYWCDRVHILTAVALPEYRPTTEYQVRDISISPAIPSNLMSTFLSIEFLMNHQNAVCAAADGIMYKYDLDNGFEIDQHGTQR